MTSNDLVLSGNGFEKGRSSGIFKTKPVKH